MGKWFLKTLSQKKKIREDRAGEIFLKGEGGGQVRGRERRSKISSKAAMKIDRQESESSSIIWSVKCKVENIKGH
jgi:hypothetical protein